MKFILFPVLLTLSVIGVSAQNLKPGFDIDEYTSTLQRSVLQVDATFRGQVPKEKEYVRVYRSPEQGLHNKFDVWLSPDKQSIAINFRGTTSNPDSWLENFYSAMIPATGELKLSNKYTFQYKFAADPRAAVHVGWAVGIGSIAPDVVDKIQRYHNEGVKQVIVEGHSQGGALAFLMSSYLHYLREDGLLPADIVIKTYCSAGPKPGNLYYAYDFDFINRGGWAFNIINTADWVPETPFAVQTLTDMSKVNPFVNVKEVIRKQKLPVRLYLGHAFRQMKRSSNKTQIRYKRYLGARAYKEVRKYLPEFEEPTYVNSNNYTRAGTAIILQPDAEYDKQFPDKGENVFLHHLFGPYYYLANKIYRQ